MKNFWKRLFYAICPSAFYSRGRTASTNGVWFVNCGLSDYPKDLLDHLKDIHPQKWFDDESEALFFATYDYLTRVKKYNVVIKYYRGWVYITISNEKYSHCHSTLTKFGMARNICVAYNRCSTRL